MFGHPGISAFEFAGELEQERRRRGKKKLSVRTTSIASTQDDNSTVSAPAPATCVGSAEAVVVHKSQPALDDLSALQRRRGTFINHTPRGFEMRSSKKTDSPFQHASTDNFSQAETSQGSSDCHTRASNSQQSNSQYGQGSSLGSWVAERDFAVNAGAPVELDSREVVPSEMNVSRPATSYRGSVTSSRASKAAGPLPLNTSTPHSSREIKAPPTPEEKKRRRRQTPYRIASLRIKNNARHSPLEPWVAQHRREEKRSSMIDDHPPQVEIDNIGEASTFRAIQDYFDSQVGIEDSKPNTSTSRRLSSPNPPSIPPPNPPEFPRCASAAAAEPSATFPIEQLEIPDEPAPEIPDRSPKRLHNPSSLFLRSTSVLSINSDFASAAEGQYSPYDKKHEVILIPKNQGHVRLGPAARAGTSTGGRMAPPILGHEALTATTVLNDLSFYLKNTGPSPEPIIQPKKKPGLKMFKVRGKKPLAARVGSVEGSPQSAARPKPLKPACAREMTTSGGAKHLHIMIPRNTLSDDEPVRVPVAAPASTNNTNNEPIAWTEEMLNPLASTALEDALTDFNAPYPPSTPGPSSPPLRSPKTPPKTPTRLPVEDHPLASRQEQTRARKLRHLKKIKTTMRDDSNESEEADAVAGAVQTPVGSPGLVRDSFMEGVHGDEKMEEDSPINKMLRLQKRAVTLQRQNIELAEALAKIMGFETEDGDLDPEAVLKAFRQIRYSKSPEA